MMELTQLPVYNVTKDAQNVQTPIVFMYAMFVRMGTIPLQVARSVLTDVLLVVMKTLVLLVLMMIEISKMIVLVMMVNMMMEKLSVLFAKVPA